MYLLFVININFCRFSLQVEPTTPQTLAELVQQAKEIPIFTITQAIFVRKSTILPTLTTYIIPELVADEMTTPRNLATYRGLSKVVHFASHFALLPAIFPGLDSSGLVIAPRLSLVRKEFLGLLTRPQNLNYFDKIWIYSGNTNLPNLTILGIFIPPARFRSFLIISFQAFLVLG